MREADGVHEQVAVCRQTSSAHPGWKEHIRVISGHCRGLSQAGGTFLSLCAGIPFPLDPRPLPSFGVDNHCALDHFFPSFRPRLCHSWSWR